MMKMVKGVILLHHLMFYFHILFLFGIVLLPISSSQCLMPYHADTDLILYPRFGNYTSSVNPRSGQNNNIYLSSYPILWSLSFIPFYHYHWMVGWRISAIQWWWFLMIHFHYRWTLKFVFVLPSIRFSNHRFSHFPRFRFSFQFLLHEFFIQFLFIW